MATGSLGWLDLPTLISCSACHDLGTVRLAAIHKLHALIPEISLPCMSTLQVMPCISTLQVMLL